MTAPITLLSDDQIQAVARRLYNMHRRENHIAIDAWPEDKAVRSYWRAMVKTVLREVEAKGTPTAATGIARADRTSAVS